MFEPSDTSRKKSVQCWPLWIAIGFPILLIILQASPIAPNFVFVMLGVPTLLHAWAGAGIWAAILACRQMRKRMWKQAATSFVLPLAVLCVAFNFWPFIRSCNNAGDTVHFYVMHHSYTETVRATLPNGEPKLSTFNLGGMIWASRGFIYDESDEILRQPAMQTSNWKARAQNSELGCGYGALRVPGPSALTEHWYIASFGC